VTTKNSGLDASSTAVPLTLFKPFAHSSHFLVEFSIIPFASLAHRPNHGNRLFLLPVRTATMLLLRHIFNVGLFRDRDTPPVPYFEAFRSL
jgi:hypothetical protein